MTDAGGSSGVDHLSASLAGSEDECPIPSAHDKIGEAHYFIHEMVKQYHHPHPFRYSLSAFLQAARSSTLMLQKELAQADGFEAWWESRRARMAADPDLKLLSELRVEVFHRSALVPASSLTVGLFQYGRLKAGVTRLKADPMTDSLASLLAGRGKMLPLYGVHPHRAWSGEELGVQRKWSLDDLKRRELVGFCMASWVKLAEIVAEAHGWLGRTMRHEASCHEWLEDAAVLRESEVFSEVEKAWEGPPTEEVRPRNDSLLLLEAPHEEAAVLHKIAPPPTVKGWVGESSGLWPSEYLSMLVYSIDGTVVTSHTGVFFDRRQAVIEGVPPPEEEET